ncbi:MAG: V-type ATPase subunit [Eubacterium sp.]|nr:V-type ATPase subunit [Eubacterium sp.]
MGEKYVYAVARIRALETSLLKNTDIEQLISLKSYEQCVQLLEERGWGDSEVQADGEKMLEAEERKTWDLIDEFKVDLSNFDVLRIPKRFHNLKAAIKAAVDVPKNINLYYDTVPGGEEMRIAVQNGDFKLLPENMQAEAKEAYESLVHTGDGQLCDIIIDKACMDAIHRAGEASKTDIIREYAESIVAVANIKIAVRSQKTGKSAEFMKRAMSKCNSINIESLIKAALLGKDEIASYLETTSYKDGVEALRTSQSMFECWCDNRIIKTIKPQKYNAFTIGPIFAYVIARLNEIKTIRIVLTGKQNGLSEEAIRERVREMYA